MAIFVYECASTREMITQQEKIICHVCQDINLTAKTLKLHEAIC